MILVLALPACLAPPDDGPEATFEALWAEFDLLYGPSVDRGADWDAAWDTFRPRVGPDTSDDELWAVITEMLVDLDDGHVQLAAPDRPWWFSNRVYRDQLGDDRFDRDVVRDRYLTEVVDREEILSGRLDGDLAYVHFPFIADNLRGLRDVLDAVPDAPALVVDLRHDQGGDSTWAFQQLRVLTDEDRPVFRSRTRDGAEGSFDDWSTWTLRADRDARPVPVVLLTDRFTISAGERTAMALQALPGTITVGEPTNGALSTMIWRELPNRWTVSVPTQEVERVDGGRFEGVGLPVDVQVVNDPEALAEGHDAALEEAIAQARGTPRSR